MCRAWWIRASVLIVALMAALGLACHDCEAHVGEGEAWGTCDTSIRANEEIQVKIPMRLALHLTETSWTLDLAAPPLGDRETGEGCFLVPKNFTGGPEDLLEMVAQGELTPVDSYPAIVDHDGDGKISDDEKGTLVCFNKKILQKFCNNWEEGTNYGCEFDLKVNVVRPAPFEGSYGRMFFYDEVTLPPVGEVQVNPYVEIVAGQNDDGDPIEMLKVRGARFPGWLDDYITEGFWFDGSEEPGEYQFNVVFMLTAI